MLGKNRALLISYFMLLPVLFFAAMGSVYLTLKQELPIWVSIVLIGLTLAMIVVLPVIQARKPVWPIEKIAVCCLCGFTTVAPCGICPECDSQMILT